LGNLWIPTLSRFPWVQQPHAYTTLAKAADKAGVDEKTARKYRDSDRLPTERRAPHTWRTRVGRSIASPSLASFRNVTVDQ
jgi:hypothetical protein